MKRALAVKMILFDFKTADLCALLNVSDTFVSKWQIRFESEGATALKLNYKGGKGFLMAASGMKVFFISEGRHIIALKNCEMISNIPMEWPIIQSNLMMTF